MAQGAADGGSEGRGAGEVRERGAGEPGKKAEGSVSGGENVAAVARRDDAGSGEVWGVECSMEEGLRLELGERGGLGRVGEFEGGCAPRSRPSPSSTACRG